MMKQIQFHKAVYKIGDIPKEKFPEVVLCGRSNVGKSSFINCLLSSKTAKTSSQPGKTRSINYYLVDHKFFFVDLPGFGFAKVSKAERDSWQKLIDEYFKLGRNIRLVVHLIDSRHEPGELDLVLNEYLNNLGMPCVVVLNKIDKLKQSEIAKARKDILMSIPGLESNKNLFTFSAVNGIGKKELIKVVNSSIIE
jgi:GTP-binding protein